MRFLSLLFSIIYLSTFAQEQGNYVVDLQNKKGGQVFAYSDGKKWGLITGNNQVILKPAYDSIGNFERRYGEPFVNFYVKKKVGILDRRGKVVLAPLYDNIIHDGYLLVGKKAGILLLKGKYGFVQQISKGVLKETHPCVLDSVIIDAFGSVGHPMYGFKKNNKWGLYYNQKVIVEPIYDKIDIFQSDVFSDKHAKFFKGDKVFLYNENTSKLEDITQKSAKAIEEMHEYDSPMMEVMPFSDQTPEQEQPFVKIGRNVDGTFEVEYGKKNPQTNVFEKGKWEDEDYKVIKRLSFRLDKTGGYKLIVQRNNGKYGIIDEQNKIILPIEYDDIRLNIDFNAGEEGFVEWTFATIRKGKKYGIINDDGEVLLPAEYKYVADAGQFRLFWINQTGQKGYWMNNKIYYPK